MAAADPAPILDLIDAFRRSKVMFTAVSAGLFDLLEGGESFSSVAIAASLGWNSDAAERLLDACVALGLLEKSDGLYRNAPISEIYLRQRSPETLAGYILYSDRALYRLWGHLDDAVREGSNRWEQTFGPMPGGLFQNFFQTEESKRNFLAGMHGMGQLSSPAVVKAFDLSRYSKLVDLGGATGHLAIEACRAYPDLHAAVFDLPEVIPVAAEYVAAAGMSDRIELIPGDFFRDPLPTADLYALGRILHDWREERIRLLLAKIRERGGALLISERLLRDDKSGPVGASLQSLNMLVCTEGKERTVEEYAELLHDAGFQSVRAVRTGAPTDALLAEP